MKARLVQGALHPSSFRALVLGQKKLWTCGKCHQKTFREGNSLLDPSDDGKSLVPHPCEFIHAEKLPVSHSGSAPIQLGRQRSFAKAKRSEKTGRAIKLCRMGGCQSPIGKGTLLRIVYGRRYFCARHWVMLTAGLRKWLAEACDRDIDRAISAARRYLNFKESRPKTEQGSPTP